MKVDGQRSLYTQVDNALCVARFCIKRAPNVNFHEHEDFFDWWNSVGVEQHICCSFEAKYPVVTKYSSHIFHCSITAYSLLSNFFYGTNQNVNVIIEGLVYFSYIRSSVNESTTYAALLMRASVREKKPSIHEHERIQ